MSGRRSLFLLIFALGFGVPSSAQAACGVPSARAVYETPEVQVYERAKNRRVRDVIACLRATGKARKVDVRANDGMGTDEFSTVNEVLGGRWIWTSLLGSAAESADTREERLTDLRTGETFSIVTEDEFNSRTALAVRGALVVAGEEGVIAHFTDGEQGDARDGAEHRPGRQRRACVLARAGRRAHGDAHPARGRSGTGAAARAHDQPLQAAAWRTARAAHRIARPVALRRRGLGLPHDPRPELPARRRRQPAAALGSPRRLREAGADRRLRRRARELSRARRHVRRRDRLPRCSRQGRAACAPGRRAGPRQRS